MTGQQGAWCHYCEQWRPKGARFCSICATPINAPTSTTYTTAEVVPPWQQHRGQWQEWGEAQRTWSNAPGGNQRLSQSPRGRRRGRDKGGKDKGGKDKQGKGKAHGKTGEVGKGLALPPPPAPPQINAPNHFPGAPQLANASTAEQQLGALISALQAQKQELPSTVLQAMEGIAHSTASAEAKEHHRAVKQQTKAKQELAKVRAQRYAAMSAWAQYLKDVTATVTKQMADQQTVVQQLDDAEAAANTELSRLSDARPSEEAVAAPAEDNSADTPMAMEALSKKRKALETEQHSQLLASLTAASKTADSMVQAVRREGSRTPRRQRTSHEAMDIPSSPELAKDGEEPPRTVRPEGPPPATEGGDGSSKPFAQACG